MDRTEKSIERVNRQQNTYNHASHIGQPMMQSQMPRRRVTWQQRLLGENVNRPLTLQQERTLPNWMVGASVGTFIIAFIACSVTYGYVMPIQFASYSLLSLLLFFYGSRQMLLSWKHSKDRQFAKDLFIWALGVRLIWVVFSYAFFNNFTYGKVDGYGDDNGWYMEFAKIIAQWLRGDNKEPIGDLLNSYRTAIDDTGYPFWLAVLYILSFEASDVFVPFIVKAFLSAYSCLCIYRVARRHFGDGAARMAGIFMCLNPYVLFWCPSLLKETEMMFLCCVYVDKTDEALSSGKRLTFLGLLPGMLAASALFFFRAPLGVVAILAILVHIVFASRRVMNAGKKVLIGLMVGLVLMVGMGDRIRTQSETLLEQVRSGQQQSNMEWRSKRVDEGGKTQSFAKYAGAAVFAPLIFTIPFPTFNMANEAHVSQMQLSGANYIKNILSFFVVYVMIVLLLSGEWRKHVFILAYTLGYHLVLVMSNFAQSGRFHMPVFPMILLFAAFGIQVAKTNTRIRKWFPIVLAVEVVVCLVWNWFKLAGRGMI